MNRRGDLSQLLYSIMFNQVRKFKSYDGRLSRVISFPSAANKFLLQFTHFSSPAADALELNPKDSNPEPFSAVYLKNEHGVPPKRALMYSKYLKFDSPEKPLSVIAFLKNHHFNDSHISSLVKKWPLVFRYVPESNYLPKIEFLRDLGFSNSEIVKVLILQPNLLDRSVEDQMVPCVDFLRSFLHSDEDVVFSILRYPGILRENLHNTLLPNVATLREAGVPESHISALLRVSPRRIAVAPESFRLIVEEVLKLGFSPVTKAFITGLTVMRQLSSSSWKEKVEYYTRWGWSEHQVLDAFKKNPRIMAVSKDKISRILNFIINTMNCDVSVFTIRPGLLLLSFEERIVPRCDFFKVLLAKGLVKQHSSLGMMLVCPQRLFHKKYVERFEEKYPELSKLYEEIFGKPKV